MQGWPALVAGCLIWLAPQVDRACQGTARVTQARPDRLARLDMHRARVWCPAGPATGAPAPPPAGSSSSASRNSVAGAPPRRISAAKARWRSRGSPPAPSSACSAASRSGRGACEPNPNPNPSSAPAPSPAPASGRSPPAGAGACACAPLLVAGGAGAFAGGACGACSNGRTSSSMPCLRAAAGASRCARRACAGAFICWCHGRPRWYKQPDRLRIQLQEMFLRTLDSATGRTCAGKCPTTIDRGAAHAPARPGCLGRAAPHGRRALALDGA